MDFDDAQVRDGLSPFGFSPFGFSPFGFSPFGRGDARIRLVTEADEHLLRGQHEPLRVLVPVLIGSQPGSEA
jgi:hypothetical protein